jgi:hypothetical protein
MKQALEPPRSTSLIARKPGEAENVRPARSTARMSFRIAMKLRRAILDGRLPPDQPLPSEGRLAAELDVGRSTIREAIVRLANEGLLKIRRGKGTVGVDWLREGSFDLLRYLIYLRRETAEGATLVRQLLWLRRIVYVNLPQLLSLDDESTNTHLGSAGWIRCHTPVGRGWRETEPRLNGEEGYLCTLAEKTGSIPVILLTQSIRRYLRFLASHAPREEELDPSLALFDRLGPAAEDPKRLAEILDEICRLREETYVALAGPAPKPEATENPEEPPSAP